MKSLLCLLLAAGLSAPAWAAGPTWPSPTLGAPVGCTPCVPASPLRDAAGRVMTIVYLERLGVAKPGPSDNDADVRAMVDEGYQVVRLDYGGSAAATSPGLNRDIIAINDALATGAFGGLTDISASRSYVVVEGYRLVRDVAYYRDDPTVYNWPGSPYTESGGDSLYMDIVCPTSAEASVPVVLSFSYSNSSASVVGGRLTDDRRHQRLSLGNTLASFDDTVLEGAPLRGMAWAIADHPKYCEWGQGKPRGGANKDYGAIEVNPDAARKVKSAVRTLRSVGRGLGLSGQIAVYGFSRGSTAGSLAIGDLEVADFSAGGRGCWPEADDHVQAAVLGPGVFDYALMPESSAEYQRAVKAWGAPATHRAAWELQASAALCTSAQTAPTLFFYNSDDAAYYATQVTSLSERLRSLGVVTEVIRDYGTGHSVPTDAASLRRIYDFLTARLQAAASLPAVEAPGASAAAAAYNLLGQRVPATPAGAVTVVGGRKVLFPPADQRPTR